MRNVLRLPGLLCGAALAAAAGCATQPAAPPAPRVVYEVREVPVVVQYGWDDVPRGYRVVRDDPEDEARRRAWLDANYGPGQAPVAAPAEDRYVPEQEAPVRERVIYVEREPRWQIPPPVVNFGYWNGHGGHHHDGWGWGVGWGLPLWW